MKAPYYEPTAAEVATHCARTGMSPVAALEALREERLFAGAAITSESATQVKAARFENVSCSQCGRDFGPGEHGFSNCHDHAAPTEPDEHTHSNYADARAGEILGHGLPDWPDDLHSFKERKAYQRGVADCRVADKAAEPRDVIDALREILGIIPGRKA